MTLSDSLQTFQCFECAAVAQALKDITHPGARLLAMFAVH
jgi:hypothetical protein